VINECAEIIVTLQGHWQRFLRLKKRSNGRRSYDLVVVRRYHPQLMTVDQTPGTCVYRELGSYQVIE